MKKKKEYSEKVFNKSEAKNKEAHFGLSNEIKQYINLNISEEEISDFSNFLQKLHLRYHALTSKETVHEIYRSDEEISENEIGFFSDKEEGILEEVKNAVSEHDIVDLRNNLIFISRNISAHNYSIGQIEDFLEEKPDKETCDAIRKEASINLNLSDDIRLQKDIDLAICEKDIMKLRAEIRLLFWNESSHSRSVKEIEDYLNSEMEEKEIQIFEDEMRINSDLMADVKLFSEINLALNEKDIIFLRENLIKIKITEIKSDHHERRGIIPVNIRKMAWYAAASVILMIGLNVTFYNRNYTNSELFDKYYRPFESSTGLIRSGIQTDDLIGLALNKYNEKDYDQAYHIFSQVLKKDNNDVVANFYSGTILQMKNNYKDAIQAYANVIDQGDNLFMEQAEWYIGLCYLQNNERKMAINQFRKISGRNAYYKKNSDEILKKLK